MNTNQTEVINWWHSGRDYQYGVMLLSKFSKRKNNILVNTLMKAGKEKFIDNHKKLQYELTKIVGLNWKAMPKPVNNPQITERRNSLPLPKAIDTPAANSRENTETQSTNKKDYEMPNMFTVPISQLPKIIRRIMYQRHEVYVSKATLFNRMKAIPAENTEKNKADRAKLRQAIIGKTTELEYFYGFLKNYKENGVIPTEEDVWPKQKEESNELPDNADALKKLKINLQTYNSKDRNRLLYQGAKKLEHENLMPEGPKRKKIENRIAEREKEILRIDEKLYELEK